MLSMPTYRAKFCIPKLCLNGSPISEEKDTMSKMRGTSPQDDHSRATGKYYVVLIHTDSNETSVTV
jgi:hypothetical protein